MTYKQGIVTLSLVVPPLFALASALTTTACKGSALASGSPKASATSLSGNFRDASLPVARRTELLLREMTLEEKVGQMCQYVGSVQNARSDNVDEVAGYALALGDKVELVRAGRVGSFLKVPGLLEANYLQKQAESSRLGIPLLIGTDAIHGHGMDVAAATIYPTPIGLAATFDTDLVKRIAQQTAAEMRATGFHWTFSPNVDISRDPRWGRTGETFGEDPWLAGELGAAMVEGYQGEDFSKPNEVLSCVKHLVGGGIADNAVNGSPAEVSERTLREVFLPPFERAVRAGAYTLMPAHNDVNGVPCHAEEQLLTKLLRQQWGFSGFVISDWLDIQRLHSVHRVAETRADADALAVMAGVDMNMHGDEFLDNVVAHVKSGRIPETRINEAARKILYAKFQLGLFENRQVAPQRASEIVLAPAHRAVALEAAQKSLVLLKNEAQTLPLQNARTVLVTGPNADDHSLLGDWAASQPPENITTVLEGMRAGAPEGVTIKSIPTGPIAAITDSQIAAAVKAAKRADSVVLVLGENSLRDNPNRTSGENVDRDSLAPRGRQVALAQAIAQTGKPVIVVLINGAPIGSEALVKSASALIEAWEPGMAGGQAIADVIFGRYNPSGRLPMTVPRSAGQLRTFYNHRPSAYHRGKFRFGSTKPLFRFGDGLSYSTFTYRELNAPKELKLGQPLTIELTVENTGSRAGDDIVLLYLQDVYASVARPVQELKAAQRVSLAPGESRRVRFTLPPEAFTLLDRNFKQSIEPGEFKLTIGQGVLTHSLWLR